MRKLVDIEPSTLKTLKILSAFEDISVKKLMEKAIEDFTVKKKKEKFNNLTLDEKEDLVLASLIKESINDENIDEDTVMKYLTNEK